MQNIKKNSLIDTLIHHSEITTFQKQRENFKSKEREKQRLPTEEQLLLSYGYQQQ